MIKKNFRESEDIIASDPMHERIDKTWKKWVSLRITQSKKKKKKEERKDYGIEKSNSGFTSVGSRSPVEGGGYGLGHIVGNSAVINTILHFF